MKAYADHFPDVGESATVNRLIDDLNEVDGLGKLCPGCCNVLDEEPVEMEVGADA